MIIINEREYLKDKVVGWIARTEPPTNAHLEYILKLARLYKKVIIISGSCYTLGNSRHCIPSIIRIKMIRAMLKEAGLSEEKYDIVPLADYESNEIWLKDLIDISRIYNINDIASGNEWVQEIVNSQNMYPLRVGDIPLDKEIPYHATDVRKAIEEGDYEKLKEYVPNSVLNIMSCYECFKNIEMANKNEEVIFVHGRQTVDMVFLLKDKNTQKLYVLLGKRPQDSVDFANIKAIPGSAIERFEEPEDACVRMFKEETGLKVELLERHFVSTPVKLKNLKTSFLFMNLVGIYSSEEPNKMGTRGGSSQCFSIYVEGDVDIYRSILSPTRGLEEVDFYEVDNIIDTPLAFQHNEMVERAVYMAKGKIKFEKDSYHGNKNSKCIYFVGGPGTGKSLAAYGVMFFLKLLNMSCEFTGEFAKEKVYEGSLRALLKSQAKIIGEQDYRVARLNGNVDYIISDAPLAISAMHASKEKPLEEAAYYLFNKTDNYIIFIERDKSIEFETNGRLEDEKDSDRKSKILKDNLEARGYNFVTVKGAIEAVREAATYIINDNVKLKEKSKEILEIIENIVDLLGRLNNV